MPILATIGSFFTSTLVGTDASHVFCQFITLVFIFSIWWLISIYRKRSFAPRPLLESLEALRSESQEDEVVAILNKTQERWHVLRNFTGIRQVRIAKELVTGNEEFERELGDGIAFGSRRVEPAERLAMAFVREDPGGVLSRILLFDWWIRNCDRALTETGGNPNLLWELDPGRVVVFDHDNAFDGNFDVTLFWQFHALRSHSSAWDTSKREEMTAWLTSGEACLGRLWDELPEEWLVDSYGDPRCELDKQGLNAVLSSHRTDPGFWSLPTSTAP